MNSNFTLKFTSVRFRLLSYSLLILLLISGVRTMAQCSNPTYCSPTVTNLNSYYIGIQNVTMGSTINNSTTATGMAPFYNDYTNMAVFASAGSTVTFSVTNGSSNSTMAIIYIDYNQDGTFGTSAPEKVWSSSNTAASATVSGSFVVPTGQALGSYRIRITGDYGGSPSNSPCQLNYGEIEDYTLIIGNSTPNVSAVSYTPTTWAVGNNTIAVTAKNLSTTTITSLNFGYSCSNGGGQSVGPITGLSIAAGGTYTYTFGTPLSLTAGSYTLKIWANNPNGVNPDASVCGDTIITTACTGISGSYTINPAGSGSTNFTTFNAAVNRLAQCGVSGAVTITVAAGTYNEQISIPSIPGISATNNVVFDGVDTSTRTISFNTGTSNSAVIQLNGAKYVTIKRLNIVNTTTTTNYNGYYGVQITNSANNNIVQGCKISVNVIGSTFIYYPLPVAICGSTYSTYGDNGNNNTIDGNRMIGGYYGMTVYGSTNVPLASTGNKIINNKMEQMYYYGIYVQYESNLVIDNNTITMGNYNTNDYGMQFYYVNNCTITRNYVKSSYYGINFYTYNYYNSGTITMANNMLQAINSSTYYYGMYIQNCNNGKFYHNTIFHDRTNGYAFYSQISDAGSSVQNNIFMTTSSLATPLYVYYAATSYFTKFDNNTIVAPAGTVNYAYFGGVNYATMEDLKLANSAFNQNNNKVAPTFVSNSDIHLSSALEHARGIVGLGVTIDIDGDARCPFAPSIGADESKYAGSIPVAGFTTPDTIFVNSPVSFLNNNPANAPLGHRWYLNGNLVSTNINYGYTFTATGTYTIKLVTFGCTGSDSITKTITVYNPTQKPVADFIVDLNVVETYQQVQLTDLSTKGPTYWYWTFTPSAGVNYNNGTSNLSRNPNVSFTNPGLYQVCMWDSNLVGRSTTICKTAYILVRATNQMCIFPFDTKVASGSLYDDGGPNGNYSANGTCNFLIDPCASSVNLKFTSFALSSSSYLRIYNGNSNYAPPLHTGLGFTGTNIPGGLAGITASSGKMYIEFVKGTSAAGFASSWTSTPASVSSPSGKLLDPDTVYDCGAVTTFAYAPNNLGFDKDAAIYRWYFDYANSSSFPDVEAKGAYMQDWAYGSTGSYVIRLEIEGCGGTEIIYDTITVAHPNTGPIVDFKADLLVATPSDVVNLSDLSKLDPVWWKWTITGPGAVNSASGNSNSKNYGVKFTTPGVYTVTLKDSNCVGSNTVTKSNYITIINYCVPVVTNTNSADFAIERFMLGRADTIINNTVYGLDFTNTTPAVGTVTYRDNTNQFTTYIINNVTLANKPVEATVGLGESFNFSVKRLSNFNSANFKIWVDYNQDGTFSASELAASSGSTSGINFTGAITIPQSAKLGYTRLRIGTNFDALSNTPCGVNAFGDFNDFRVKITPDITPPVITVTGGDTVFVEVGRTFTDPGTTVTGATTVTHTGFAFGSTVTTYPSLNVHTITATDAANNTAIKNIYVRATKDVTKPVLTMTGGSPKYVEVGSAYVDSGATATDFYFGSITSSIVATSTVNINKIGTYTVTYNVNDAAGNAATPVVRTVIVRDTQIPIIAITGANPLYVNVFSTFNAPVATVTDNYNTGLTYTVTGGPVNTTILGSYQLFYNAKDSSGNVAATKTLTVIVQDVTAPQLTLLPQDTMIIDCITLTTVPEPGYVVSDNYYPSNQITVSKVGSVNLNVLGTYTIRYYATDPSGNVDSSKVRVYRVVDRGAPVITLKGLNIMNWPRWKNFVTGDPGWTVTDHCDPTVSVIPDYTKLNIYLEGLYEVTYNAVDASGNKAVELKRYVNIYTEVSGINKNGGNNTFVVYPNPNSGLVNVELNVENAATTDVMVFDINGKLVYSTKVNPVNSKIQMDLSNEAPGMYFIKVASDNFSASKTFTIIK